jgi:hypothetical protein
MAWDAAPEVKKNGSWADAPEVTREKMSAGQDVVHSAPTGLVHGISALAGFPGDLEKLSRRGMQYVTDHLLPADAAGVARQVLNTPTGHPDSAEVDADIQKLTGPLHEPDTVPGQYAETISSFLPNAVMPGSLLQRAARVAVPGAASETAGQLAKGTKYEGAARAAGAVVGGIGQGMAEGALSKAPPMSMDELGKAKAAAYKAAEQAGVTIKPDAFKAFSDGLATDITTNNVAHPELHKSALAALATIQKEAESGVPISLERADAVRQVVNNAIEAGGKNNGGDLRLAQKVKRGLDDFLDNLTPADTVSGDASVAVPILKEARGLAQREFKAKKIQELVDLAENQSSTNYSASGYEQALRAQFKNFNAKLIKDPQLAKSFSAEERDAITKVAKGGPVGNVLRWLGKFSPNGSVQTNMASSLGLTAGGGAGYMLSGGNPVVAAGTALAGQAATLGAGGLARSGATALTSRNARMAEELMRAGAPNPGATQVGQQMARNPRSLMLSTLLSQAGH